MARVAPVEGAIICGRAVAPRSSALCCYVGFSFLFFFSCSQYFLLTLAHTTVYVTSYAAHHSERNLYDPEGFHPERWLPDPDPCFSTDKLSACEPFSLGPRNCIGKNLAWHEMQWVLTAFLLSFDIALAEQAKNNWLDQKAYLVWERPPLYIKLIPQE
ncbi:cytochrome P450 [Macrophomina phaseolina]|uniref:Cytochrome P450 n=1 Tax=Macrophomina phaseolina TaxID=35725 RepID=A0ABQ8G1C4_9PEZI|nr:cytochrome P450 [Macrophomina phaseolina]